MDEHRKGSENIHKIVPLCKEGISFCRVLCSYILPPERSPNPKRFCQHLPFKTDFPPKRQSCQIIRMPICRLQPLMGCSRHDTDARRVLNKKKKEKKSLFLFPRVHAHTFDLHFSSSAVSGCFVIWSHPSHTCLHCWSCWPETAELQSVQLILKPTGLQVNLSCSA